MEIQILQYQIEHNGYTFKATLYKDGWSVTGRPSEAVNIPPYINILTVDGWQNVLKQNANVKKFDTIADVLEYLDVQLTFSFN